MLSGLRAYTMKLEAIAAIIADESVTNKSSWMSRFRYHLDDPAIESEAHTLTTLKVLIHNCWI